MIKSLITTGAQYINNDGKMMPQWSCYKHTIIYPSVFTSNRQDQELKVSDTEGAANITWSHLIGLAAIKLNKFHEEKYKNINISKWVQNFKLRDT
jgi:hypothetical protein